jgi:hypothetical protein
MVIERSVLISSSGGSDKKVYIVCLGRLPPEERTNQVVPPAPSPRKKPPTKVKKGKRPASASGPLPYPDVKRPIKRQREPRPGKLDATSPDIKAEFIKEERDSGRGKKADPEVDPDSDDEDLPEPHALVIGRLRP